MQAGAVMPIAVRLWAFNAELYLIDSFFPSPATGEGKFLSLTVIGWERPLNKHTVDN